MFNVGSNYIDYDFYCININNTQHENKIKKIQKKQYTYYRQNNTYTECSLKNIEFKRRAIYDVCARFFL